jgi:nicotinate-nucleotide pyrophosphorylase
MDNIDKKIEEAAELAKKFEEQTNQILNDNNTPQELKDIILDTRIPDNKIIDLSGGKRIKSINPDTFEIEYE